MADSFKLHLPAEAVYRTIVPEVASRYAELSGGSAADGAALADALTSTVAKVVNGAGSGAGIELFFRPEGQHVHVDVRCGARHESVRVPLPVVRS
jgi:hypothetical protein